MDLTLSLIQTVIHLIPHIINVTKDCQIILIEHVTSAVMKKPKVIPFRGVLILGKSMKHKILDNKRCFVGLVQLPRILLVG